MAAHRTSSQLSTPSRTTWWICVLLVFAATFLTHARSINYGFSNFDDPAFVSEVDGYRGLAPDNIAWAFTTAKYGHYQPLTYLSYSVDYLLWGMNPKGFHATNVFIHSINAILVMLLTISLIRAARSDVNTPDTSSNAPVTTFELIAGLVAALFFGLHPLRVESVAWITERRDVLSCLFLLLATLTYLRSASPGSTRLANPRTYWLALLFLTLSLLAKAWGMTFFVIALVLDVYPLRRISAWPWRWTRQSWSVVAQKLPFLILGTAAAAAAVHAQADNPETIKGLEQWGIVERLSQATFGLFFYLWKTVLPTSLAALYELPSRISPTEPRVLLAAVALLLLTTTVIVLRKRAPALATAAACYVILVSPVLGLLQSGIQLVADRYSYIACIPWAILLGWAIARLATRTSTAVAQPAAPLRPAIFAPAVLALLVLAALTWHQTRHWRTTEATFARVLETGWDGPLIRRYYGKEIEQRGDRAQAIVQYRRSLELNENEGESWYALGNALRAANDLRGAEDAYRRATTLMSDPWQAWVGLGLIYAREERFPDAINAFRSAVADVERPDRSPKLAPGGNGIPYMLLAGALDMNGDPRAARQVLEHAARYPSVRDEALRVMQALDEELQAPGR